MTLVKPKTEPIFIVKVFPEGGGSRRLDITQRVLSLTYEDVEDKADKLTLSIDNFDLSQFDNPFWKKGNILEVAWGYVGNLSLTRRSVIQRVKGFNPLTIEAHDESIRLNKQTKCRVFENKRRSDVAREIALESVFKSRDQDIEQTKDVIPVITQAKLTDSQFMRRLADMEGFEFFIDFDGFHFHQRKFNQRPVRIYRWYNEPEVGEILTLSIDNDLTAKPGAINVKGRDPLEKKDVSERGSNTETKRDTLAPTTEIVEKIVRGGTEIVERLASEETRTTPQPKSGLAKREADAKFRKSQQSTIKLSMSVIGDPDIVAKTIVEVAGIGRRLSGKYYIKKALHKIRGTYVVNITAVRDGHDAATGELGGTRSKGKQNKQGIDEQGEGALERVEVIVRGGTVTVFRDKKGRT